MNFTGNIGQPTASNWLRRAPAP